MAVLLPVVRIRRFRMRDIALDTNHDLLVTGIDLALVDGAEQVRQQLLIKLKLWQGEWFLDTEFGTPYLQQILGKQLTMSGAIVALRKSILEVQGVTQITTFDYQFDRATRTIKIQFTVNTPHGLIEVSA